MFAERRVERAGQAIEFAIDGWRIAWTMCAEHSASASLRLSTTRLRDALGKAPEDLRPVAGDVADCQRRRGVARGRQAGHARLVQKHALRGVKARGGIALNSHSACLAGTCKRAVPSMYTSNTARLASCIGTILSVPWTCASPRTGRSKSTSSNGPARVIFLGRARLRHSTDMRQSKSSRQSTTLSKSAIVLRTRSTSAGSP